MGEFLGQVDGELIAKAEGSPLLKVDLQLVASEACFEPPLSGRAVPSVGAAFDEWIQAFLDTGALVARLDSGSGPDDAPPTERRTLNPKSYGMLYFGGSVLCLASNATANLHRPPLPRQPAA